MKQQRMTPEMQDEIRKIIADPERRREFAISAVIRMQQREGDAISYKQAEEIFERILEETQPVKQTANKG